MTGHIRRRGERSWELKYDAGADAATGRRKTRFVSFKGTKADAQKELIRLVAAEQSGQAIDPTRLTVAEFCDKWERDWMAVNVSPKTRERYEELLRLHVRPHLGKLQLQKLRAANLAELYATLLKAEDGPKLSARTVGHVHRVLHRALGHACAWSLLNANPAAIVRPPPVESEEVEILRPDDVKLALTKLKGRAIYPLFVLALGTGMRRGELLALRWQDVDIDGALVRVERSLEQTGKALRFKAPKTRHGRRNIAIPSFVVGELRAHWKRQQELRLALGLGGAAPDGLVFCHPEGGPLTPNALSRSWRRAAGALGLSQTFHSLRHSHASQLIASGLDVVTISRRLGHGNPAITLSVYAHLMPNSGERAAQAMDAAFSLAGTE